MAQGICAGCEIVTNDAPLSTVLRNRKGIARERYAKGNMPEWWVEFTDGDKETYIMHEKFLIPVEPEYDPLTMDELIEMQRRNLAILRSSWDAKEKESARLVARIAAEMFVERIKSF